MKKNEKTKDLRVAEIKTRKQRAATRSVSEEAQQRIYKKEMEFFNKFFLDSIDAMIILTREGRFVEFNHAFTKLLDYTKNEMKELAFQDLCVERTIWGRFQKKIETDGYVRGFKMPVRKKDGQELDCVVNMTLRTANNAILGYHGIIHDITELKQREDLATAFATNAHTGIYVLQHGILKFVNPHIIKYTGYSKKELIGREAIKLIHPEDQKKARENAIKMLKGKRQSPYEFRVIDKSGRIRWIMEHVISMTYFGEKAVLGNTRDITEEKLAKSELLEVRALETSIMAAVPHAVVVIENRKIIFANKAVETIFGWKPEDLVGNLTRVLYRTDQEYEEIGGWFEPFVEKHDIFRGEFFCRRKDGKDIICIVNSAKIHDDDTGTKRRVVVYEDITEEKEIKKSLMEAQALESSIFSAIPHAVIGIENHGLLDRRIIFANDAVKAVFGWEPEELIGKMTRVLYTSDEDYEMVERKFGSLLEKDKVYRGEVPCRRKDGQDIICMASGATASHDDDIRREVVIYENVTEEKEVKAKLSEAKMLETSIMAAVPHAIIGVEDRRIIFANDAVEGVFGWKAETLIGESTRVLYRSETDYVKIGKSFYSVLEEQASYSEEFPCRRKDGSGIICKISASRLGEKLEKKKLVLVYEDVTGKKQAEEALKESEQKYSAVVEQAMYGVVIVQSGRYQFANRAMSEICGYRIEELIGMPFLDIFPLECRKGIFSQFHGKRTDVNAALPYETKMLCKGGTTKDVELAFGIIYIKGKPADVGFVRDITVRRRAQEDLKLSFERLQRRLEETVEALSSITEKRDPYTAGHQQRVAQLARAIAEELKYPKERIEGIVVASVLHDIGKISEPSEILSKPGILTDIEFLMMKVHPEIAYDILKNIKFPWPVAQIVKQHHEKMNGTGYPEGLIGNDILPEARIIAVADVVEAMASHRPYRPALGIEAALSEVTKNRGILYDSEVVNACVRLFREKGFEFDYRPHANMKLR